MGFPVLQNWFSCFWFFVCRDPENRKPYLWFSLVFCLLVPKPSKSSSQVAFCWNGWALRGKGSPSPLRHPPLPISVCDLRFRASSSWVFFPFTSDRVAWVGWLGLLPVPISPCRFRLYPLICVSILLRSVSHRSLVFLRSTWCSCDFCDFCYCCGASDCVDAMGWVVCVVVCRFPVCPVPSLPIALWFVFCLVRFVRARACLIC